MTESGIGQRRVMARKDSSENYSRKRKEIALAAAEVFRTLGYDASSLNDVAAKLGTNRSSLYYYVSSKAELFQIVTQEAVEEVTRTAEQIAGSRGTPSERLRDLVISTLVAYERHYPYMFAYIQEDMARVQANSDAGPWADIMMDLGNRYQAAVTVLIDEGIADGTFVSDDSRIAANALVGAVNWTHRWFRPGAKHAADRVGQMIADMFLNGLRTSHVET